MNKLKLLVVASVAAAQAALFGVQTLRIMPVGDSITEGACGTKSGYRYFLYRDLVADGYAVDYVGDLQNNQCAELTDPDHSGHSGWFLGSTSAPNMSSIQDQIGGWLDTLALAGTLPDVILLHAGTNDASRREPLTDLPDALRAVLSTIATKAPNAHVIITTVLERKDVSNWGDINWDKNIDDNFNSAVSGIAAESGNRVHFIDMRSKLTQPDDFNSDLLHPNDSGYQKMADAWRTKIESIFGTRTWTLADAEAERACYTCIYDFTPVTQIDGGTPASIYTVNRAAELAGTTFDRVGYYMELQKSGGEKQWVWVSFEAMTDNLAKIGVPYDYFYNGSVTNMNVYSNVDGVDNLAQITGGRLEFWPYSYGAGIDGLFDYQDDMGGDGFGSMQIHNTTVQKTVFSYSGWNNGSFNAALGIGNCPFAQRQNSDPDWTFAQNIGSFEVKNIKVYAHLSTDPALPALSKIEDDEGGGDDPSPEEQLVEEDAGLMVILNGTTAVEVERGKKLVADAVTTETGAIVKDGPGVLEFGAARAMGYAADYNPQANLYGLDFLAHGPNVTVYDGSVEIGAPTTIDSAAMTTTPFIHFDASEASTLTTVQDGDDTRVSEWRDPVTFRAAVGGFSKNFDNGETRTMPLPYLVADALNGKPVVDFGTYVEAQNGTRPDGQWWCLADYDLSTSGTLRFQDTHVRELFMVVKTTERRKQPFYLGSEYSNSYDFSPGGYGTMGFPANNNLNNGECRVDGVRVRPDQYVPDQEFHVVALSPLDTVYNMNTLTLDRHCRIGGMALAEILIYNTPLSVEERRAVESYLMQKWFNKAHPMAGEVELGDLTFTAGVEQNLKANRDATIGTINGTGTFTKSGSGDVTATGLADTITGLAVTGGSLAFAGAANPLDVMDEASFHIDPSDVTTLVKSGDNVTRINDVRSAVNRYAETSTQSKAAGPTLVACAETGRNLLDFGTFAYNVDSEQDDSCGMKWDRQEQVFTVFAVIEKKAGNDSFLLGSASVYDFHADDGNLLSGNYSSYTVRPGSDTDAHWYLDGEAVANPTGTSWPSGLHLITVTMRDTNAINGNKNAGPWAGMFAQDRELCRIGGMRYGEVVVFTNSISSAQVKAITGYLMEKWLGSAPDTSGGFQNLSVAAGSSLSYDGDFAIADNAAVEIGYAGRGGSGTIEVTGNVTLGRNVAVTVSNEPKGRVALVSAGGFSDGAAAAVRTWTINGGTPKFSFDGNVLYAEFGSRGFSIFVR